MRNTCKISVRKPEGMRPWETCGREDIKLVLNKSGVRVRNGRNCFRICYSGGKLATR